jgi:hypothetical protein
MPNAVRSLPIRITPSVRHLGVMAALLLSLACSSALAQSHFLPSFQGNANAKAYQPSWTAPTFTSYVELCQLFRGSANRQRMPAGNSVWNIDNGKGFNLITSTRTEFDINLPNYVSHNDGTNDDGFGDFAIGGKYRIASGNEHHGNYMITALFSDTWNTGQLKNGAVADTRVYTLAGGKGLANFDVQSTFGITVAGAGGPTIGTPLASNTAFQYHATRYIWVELEDNSTFYVGGSKDGKKQTYLAPGIILAKIKPHAWEDKSEALTFGTGMQIATTHYRASDHNWTMDAKLSF